MELLTNSRIKAFRACQRLHFYSFVLGIKALFSSNAAAFGTIIHAALEAYWRARQAFQPERRDGWLDWATDAAMAALPADMDAYARARAEVMLAGYTARWNQRPDVEVLGVEVEFRLPLINPDTGRQSPRWSLSGKIDLILRLEDGRISGVEHKTSSEDVGEGSQYRTRLTLDGQVGQYFEGMDALGFPADLFIYDVLGKPGQVPSLATPIEKRKYTEPKSRACALCKKKGAPPAPHDELDVNGTEVQCSDGRIVTDPGGKLYANLREFDETPDEYRDRVGDIVLNDAERYFVVLEIHRLESEREEYRFDVWQIAAQIRQGYVWPKSGADTDEHRPAALELQKKRAPRNPDACFRYGSRCEFLDVCLNVASIDDATRFERAANVNPELSSADSSESAHV